MDALDLVELAPLMARTDGLPEGVIGLIDGPIAIDHPDLDLERIRLLSNGADGACTVANSAACRHGTFISPHAILPSTHVPPRSFNLTAL